MNTLTQQGHCDTPNGAAACRDLLCKAASRLSSLRFGSVEAPEHKLCCLDEKLTRDIGMLRHSAPKRCPQRGTAARVSAHTTRRSTSLLVGKNKRRPARLKAQRQRCLGVTNACKFSQQPRLCSSCPPNCGPPVVAFAGNSKGGRPHTKLHTV